MLKRNLSLFKLDCFLGGFWPLSAVAIIYFALITKSYTTAMLVFSVLNIMQSLSELPAGIISDKLGRKLTLISGTTAIFIGYLLWAIAGHIDNISLLFLGSLFVGFGNASLSGTDNAIIYETLEELSSEHDFDCTYSANKSFEQLGFCLSAALATIAYYYGNINILAWISVVPALFRIVVVSLFTEPKRISKTKETSWNHFIKSWLIIWHKPRLFKLAIITSFHHSLNAAHWRFIGAYYQTLISPWIINLVRVFQEFMGFISFCLVRFVRKFQSLQLLFVSISLNALIKLIGLAINTAITPFIMASSTIMYGISSTVENTLLQQQFTDRQRATLGSVVSLLGNIMCLIVFTLTGIIADLYSPYIAISILIASRLIIGMTYPLLLRKK